MLTQQEVRERISGAHEELSSIRRDLDNLTVREAEIELQIERLRRELSANRLTQAERTNDRRDTKDRLHALQAKLQAMQNSEAA